MRRRRHFGLMIGRGLVVLAVVVAAAAPAGAEPPSLTLDGALAAALAGHPDFARDAERIRRSEGAVKQAEAVFDWTAFADAGLHRIERPIVSGGFLTDDTDTDYVLGGTVGVSKQFESGVVVQPGVSVFEDTGEEAQENLTQTDTAPAIRVTVPLLKFGARNPDAAKLRAAELGVDAARLESRWRGQTVLHKAAVAYWGALAARKQFEIASWVQGQAEQVVASVKQLVDRGELAPTAYQDLAAGMLYRALDVDSVRESYVTARFDLAAAIGAASTAADALPVPEGKFPEDLPEVPEGDAVDQWYVDLALANRPDLGALTTMERAESLKLEGARNDSAPRLDLDLGVDKMILRYVMSLNNSGADGRVMERSAAAGEARLDIDSLRRAIGDNVRQTLRRLRHSRRAYLAAAEANQMIDVLAADFKRRTATGSTTPEEQLAMFDRIGQAKQRLVRAAHDYAAGIADLRLALSAIPVEEASSVSDLSLALRAPPVPAQ